MEQQSFRMVKILLHADRNSDVTCNCVRRGRNLSVVLAAPRRLMMRGAASATNQHGSQPIGDFRLPPFIITSSNCSLPISSDAATWQYPRVKQLCPSYAPTLAWSTTSSLHSVPTLPRLQRAAKRWRSIVTLSSSACEITPGRPVNCGRYTSF